VVGWWLGGNFRIDQNATKTRLLLAHSRLKNCATAQAGLITMTDQPQSKIIKDNPIGKGLHDFHTSFKSLCEDRSLSCKSDALGQLGQEGKIDQHC
jgi:hypothetical protein